MLDPYRMVAVNIVASLLLICSFICYKFIYPKRTPSFPSIIFLVSLLPLISLLREGSYESGDLTLHATRFLSFYHALQEGILLPQWSGDLNAGYGYPLFIFVQTFPNHIASIFHTFGLPMVDSIKFLFAVSFIASGMGMYWWAKEEFGKNSGIVASIFYLFAPYHLVDMHFRANPGEVLSFAFLPLCTLSIKKLFIKPTIIWFVIGSSCIASLILSHPIAIILFPFIVAYTGFLFLKQRQKKKSFMYSMLTMVCGLFLSTYYWLPEIIESKYTHQAYYHADVLFTQLHEFIYSPWRMGLLFQGPYGELSFIIGYIQWAMIIFTVILLIKKKLTNHERIHAYFYLFIFFLLLFFMLPYSSSLWDIFPIMHNLQFSYRILVLETFIASAIAAVSVKKITQNWIIVGICAFAVLSTILNWGNRRTIPAINDAYIEHQLPYSSKVSEGSAPSTPIWLDPKNPWADTIATSPIEILEGKAEYKILERKTIRHEYIVSAETNVYLKENTVYFPGWSLRVNNKSHIIEYKNDKYTGLITFHLPKGLYKIELVFQNTPIRTISQMVSGITTLGLTFLLILDLLKKKENYPLTILFLCTML